MYANDEIAQTLPFPQVLTQPYAGRCRRSHVAGAVLDPGRLDSFNALLGQLGRSHPLQADQIATAARILAHATAGANDAPPCIRHRLDLAGQLAPMVGDRAWAVDEAMLPPALSVLAYLGDSADLIPDDLACVGRLDDALVIDAAWPRLAAEVAGFVDFCRLRRLEAQWLGSPETAFRFDRNDWKAARLAEATLNAHRDRVWLSSYVPAGGARFQVH
ncbi:hypothetical protein E4582_02205 [Luteimonas yindakuii]|uniref:Uncharacterized protein n=1 Tax=Luteimonas yindakuii TaxID=2565782 RepID=A0A4Z1RHT6_9GAMM|nr:hypothetical protein [Luteimonas yindakuii]QCO67454.1 hypothetical protein E5843_06110 [Luteimonas yindakuii]TKS53699.1 hypothetical protein E4582_02205 [Luteimonas yindakuii]